MFLIYYKKFLVGKIIKYFFILLGTGFPGSPQYIPRVMEIEQVSLPIATGCNKNWPYSIVFEMYS